MRKGHHQSGAMDVYRSRAYLGPGRLIAYIEQYKYVKKDDRVLEVGPGPGVFKYLVENVATYESLDISEEVNADIVGDLNDPRLIAGLRGKYDSIFCCQVLEHLPMDDARTALTNLFDLGAARVVISVPDVRRALPVGLQFPGINRFRLVSIPFTGPRKPKNPYHFWEINRSCWRDALKWLREPGEPYELQKDFRLVARPSQHFFIYTMRE
jgi:hypothetical protein